MVWYGRKGAGFGIRRPEFTFHFSHLLLLGSGASLIFLSMGFFSCKNRILCNFATRSVVFGNMGELLEMQTVRPHPDLLKQNLHFYESLRSFLCTLKFEKHLFIVTVGIK